MIFSWRSIMMALFRGRRIVVLLLAAMKMVGFMLQMIRLQLAMMRVLLKSYSTLATMTMTVQELLCDSPAADSYTTVCELWTNSETVK